MGRLRDFAREFRWSERAGETLLVSGAVLAMAHPDWFQREFADFVHWASDPFAWMTAATVFGFVAALTGFTGLRRGLSFGEQLMFGCSIATAFLFWLPYLLVPRELGAWVPVWLFAAVVWSSIFVGLRRAIRQSTFELEKTGVWLLLVGPAVAMFVPDSRFLLDPLVHGGRPSPASSLILYGFGAATFAFLPGWITYELARPIYRLREREYAVVNPFERRFFEVPEPTEDDPFERLPRR